MEQIARDLAQTLDDLDEVRRDADEDTRDRISLAIGLINQAIDQLDA